jgi:hypothetical protein
MGIQQHHRQDRAIIRAGRLVLQHAVMRSLKRCSALDVLDTISSAINPVPSHSYETKIVLPKIIFYSLPN